MSLHLTEDQFAKCVVEAPGLQEQQHLAECGECAGELARFRSSIGLFRSAVRDCVEHRAPSSMARPVHVAEPRWRWALVAVTALILGVVPLMMPRQSSVTIENAQADAEADALMRAVQLQLSRTIPAPMDPVIALLPIEESPTPSGGVQ